MHFCEVTTKQVTLRHDTEVFYDAVSCVWAEGYSKQISDFSRTDCCAKCVWGGGREVGEFLFLEGERALGSARY